MPAAEGYARASGIPHGQALVKNRYIGRTFITPGQDARDAGVRRKLNPLRENIAGKRIVVVDDSIVRGTTQRAVVKMLREAGAREVHLRISSPPLAWPCFFGIDIPDRDQLAAAQHTVPEIAAVPERRLARLPVARQPRDRHRRPRSRLLHRLSHRPVPGAGPRALRRRPASATSRRPPPRESAPPDTARPADRRARPAPPTPRPASTSRRATRAVARIHDLVASTARPEVLGGIGGFGGSFAFDPARYRQPVLVSSTDGVGTKSYVASDAGRYDTIGIDLVAMCVDDIVCVGAEPLFLLDYVTTGKLDPDQMEQLVSGVADGCRQAGCALLGGEMAEHPGALPPGEFDLAGFAVGVVERDAMLGADRVLVGDVLVGLLSPGLRCNGYTLARHVLLERAGLRPRRSRLGRRRPHASPTSCCGPRSSTPRPCAAPSTRRALAPCTPSPTSPGAASPAT